MNNYFLYSGPHPPILEGFRQAEEKSGRISTKRGIKPNRHFSMRLVNFVLSKHVFSGGSTDFELTSSISGFCHALYNIPFPELQYVTVQSMDYSFRKGDCFPIKLLLLPGSGPCCFPDQLLFLAVV
eukprot:g77148.t1